MSSDLFWVVQKGDFFKSEIIKPDGSQKLTESGVCLKEDAEELGIELAEKLQSKAPTDFFS